MSDEIKVKQDCDSCTWRNNSEACAMGMPLDENDPVCPGYENVDCSECACNPCICERS
jgi:hypothetical protein